MTFHHSKRIPIILLFSLAIIACQEDDNDDNSGYSFNDENVQGLIDGQPWVYEDGYAEADVFDESKISIELVAEPLEEDCPFFAISDLSSVFFSVPAAVGIYELSLSFNESSQTVTLYEPSQTLNIIATFGAVEILTLTSNEVTGRIDARSDVTSYVNGNFSVNFCTGDE